MSSVQPSSFSKQFASSLLLAGVKLTDKELGRGSDAVVVEAEYEGRRCAAKKLHDILLTDTSSGGPQRLLANFKNEITTWYSLRHPHIVHLVGLHFEHESSIPILILEKMQSSLRKYIEKYRKEEDLVPLSDKVFILRQVSQALAYLHSREPPLVHHDLSPNNVLLNQDTLLTRITDFGMSRAVDPTHSTRKSSVKGTLAFMPPEALVGPPKYTEKLDIFSFGNITLYVVTHLWPEPGPSFVYKGDELSAVSEMQRREKYTKTFTTDEQSLLCAMVQSCLENRPDRRPTSLQLVQQMRQMEKKYPRQAHCNRISNTSAQLTQQLKNRDPLQTNEQSKELKKKDEDCSHENAVLLRDNQHLQQTTWKGRMIKYQKTLQCGRICYSIAVQGDHICVGVDRAVLLFSRTSGIQVSELGSAEIEDTVWGLAFLDDDTIAVSAGDGKVRTYTTKGQLIHSFDSGKDSFDPVGLAVDTNRRIFVCDWGNHCICIFNANGEFLYSFGSEGNGAGQFNIPRDVCMAGEGLLFISDVINSRICIYSVEGEFIRGFSTSKMPDCVAMTRCNHLVITSYWSHTAMIWTPSGQLVCEFGGRGSGPGQFRGPGGTTVDNEDCVYVCDKWNKCVHVFSVVEAAKTTT